MNRNEKDKYYHSGLGSENRRNWDRSTRDGDYGRDYENRFRTDEDRQHEVRRRHFPESGDLNSNDTRNYGVGSDYYGRTNTNYRRGYNTPDYVARMEEDREKLRSLSPKNQEQRNLGGYSGSAFGGSNYSSHGDFSGADEYGAMSGDQGNVDDYPSMSGYGGGRPSQSAGSRNYNERYGNSGSGMDRDNRTGNYSSGNQRNTNYGSTENRYSSRDRNKSDRDNRSADRGGYRNYDPNNRWND